MEKNKLSLATKISFSVTETALLLISLTLSTQLMFFMTDIVGVTAAAVGTMLLLTRIWDAINDIIMGWIVDKFNPKHGKYRPYILWGGVSLSIAIVLNFIKLDISQGGKIAFMYFAYVLFGMAYTVVFIPYTTMMSNIANDSDERTVLSSMKGGFQAFGVLFASVLTVPIVKAFGNGELTAAGYKMMAIIYAVIALVLFCITYFKVKEKPVIQESIPVKYDFKTLKEIVFTNKPLLMIMVVYFLIYFRMFLNNGTAMYFFIYKLGRPDLIPAYMGIFSGVNILVAIWSPKLTKMLGKKNYTIIGMVICFAAYIAMYSIRLTSIPLFLVFTLLMGISGGIPYILIWAFVADVADDTAKKKGYRADGLIYSATSFTSKLAAGIAGVFSGAILQYFGYVPNQPQTIRALLGIDILMFFVPAISMLLVVIPLMLYKSGEKKEEATYKLGEEKHA